MPVDITNVTVLFENGIKREEYGPTRKASVSLTAAVDKGEDGVVAMNYIATLARAKVADLLGLEVPAEARAAIEAPATEGEPARRKRRTAAEIAADNAGAAGTSGQDASATSASGTQDGTAGTGAASTADIPPTSSGSQGSDEVDEWSTGEDKASEVPAVSDADLAMHCSKHAQRLGGGEKVKGVIASYKPEIWDKPKFGVTDIPPAQRAAFVGALEALT